MDAVDHRPTLRIWVLLGGKSGDDAQVLALADRLGLPYETRRLEYNWLRRLPNPVLGDRLISLRGGDPLRAPWPDLILAIGRRSAPVALAIKRLQGGSTRLIHLGRPRAALSAFDLVITTPQYGLPDAPNVIHANLPFRPQREALSATEVAAWRRRWGNTG
ncbi:MAG: mitochondrial fission ELM1 family protein, partial [Planctomycetes bacterium]|nr:mitochondrial fission ELM1 family protein [Planctomycetota bacterium]